MSSIQIVMPIFFVIFGLIFSITSYTKLKQMRIIRDMPTSKIRSLAMGRVEVVGTAHPYGSLVNAPFSGSKCCLSKWTVQEYREKRDKDGTVSGEWETVYEGYVGNYFYVRDETGEVLLDGALAEYSIDESFETDFSDKRISAFLKTRNIPSKPSFSSRGYRFSEMNVLEGTKLFVNGIATSTPLETKGTKNEDSIIISAGKMDIQSEKVMKKEWFFVSDESEKAFLKSMSVGAYLFLTLGIILMIIGIVSGIVKLGLV